MVKKTYKHYSIRSSIQNLINSKKGNIDQDALNEASELLMEKYEKVVNLLRIYMGNNTIFTQMQKKQLSNEDFKNLFKEIMSKEYQYEEISEALFDLHTALEEIRNLYTGDFNYDILLEGANGKLHQGSFSFEQLKDYGFLQFSKTGRMTLQVIDDQLNEMILNGNVSAFQPFGQDIDKETFLSTMAKKLNMHNRQDLTTAGSWNTGWAYQWYRATQSGVNYKYLSYENLTQYVGPDTKMGQEKVGSYSRNPSNDYGTSKVGITSLFNELVSARSYLGYVPQMDNMQSELFSSLTDSNSSDFSLYQNIIDTITAPLWGNGVFGAI